MKTRNWTRYCAVALRLSTNYWMPRDAWTILATLKDKVARKSQKSKSQLLLHSGFFGRISARTCLFQYIYSFCSSPNQLTLRMTCTCLHLRRCIRHTTLGAPVLQARSSENRETAREILILWRPNAKLPGKHPKKTQIYKPVFVSFSFHSLHIRIWRFLQLQWFPRHETDEAVEGAHVTTIKTPAAEHPVDAFKRATCDNRLWKRKKKCTEILWGHHGYSDSKQNPHQVKPVPHLLEFWNGSTCLEHPPSTAGRSRPACRHCQGHKPRWSPNHNLKALLNQHILTIPTPNLSTPCWHFPRNEMKWECKSDSGIENLSGCPWQSA